MPKELWKAIKSQRFTIQDNPSLSCFSQRWGKNLFDEKTNNSFIFTNFYANLSLNLVNILLQAPNKFDLDSVLPDYKRFLNTENQKFTFSLTSEDKVLKLLNDTNPEKAAGVEKLYLRILKDGAVSLALPVSKTCNLLVKCSKLPLDCKIAKLKNHYTRKGQKQTQKTITLFHICHLSQKLDRKWFIIKPQFF